MTSSMTLYSLLKLVCSQHEEELTERLRMRGIVRFAKGWGDG